jgi:acetyl esterase/lipase
MRLDLAEVIDISPIFGDLRGLPPTLLQVGTEDILLEDSLAMAARLSAAGGEVDLRVYPKSPHGLASLPIAMGRAVWEDIEGWLAERSISAAPTAGGRCVRT